MKIPGSDDKELPAHSSVYAKAACGKRLGATSPLTFGKRYAIERNRQAIGHYRASAIGSTSHYRPDTKDNTGIAPARPQSPAAPSPQARRQAFSEPPRRPYNPYG